MKALAAIEAELQEAEALYQPVMQIRLTELAPLNSVLCVPFLPERAKARGIRWRENQRELLVHPEDWKALLSEAGYTAYSVQAPTRRVSAYNGIPVVHVERVA